MITTLAKKFNSKKLEGKAKKVVSSNESIAADFQSSNNRHFEYTKQSFVDTKMPCSKGVGKSDAKVLNSNSGREYISIHTKRMLFQKAQKCCEYRDPKTHRKCSSKYKLEIDHRHPVALGGSNSIDNLRVLCQTHNALAARLAGLQ